MAYSIDIAELLASQLAKFVTLNRHQLAGQMANLGFWMDEVRHCLGVIDGYEWRFEQLRRAQQGYVRDHKTIEFSLDDKHASQNASPPKAIPDHDLTQARKSLCIATYRFLLRAFREGFISENALRETCEGLAIGVVDKDLLSRD